MTIVPRVPHIPATPSDALLKVNPISSELADLLAPRIMRHVERRRGCWIRTAYTQKNGYTYIGQTTDGKRRYYLAHRIVYVHYFGQIPEGYTIDHLCERPACVQPKHLAAVTHRQNVLRSTKNPFAINARRVAGGAA